MANLPKELNLDALKEVSEQVSRNFICTPMPEEDGIVYAAFVNDKLIGVYQDSDEAMSDVSWRTEATEAILEQFHIYSQGQRGRKYIANLKEGTLRLIPHKVQLTCEMKTSNVSDLYPDGKYYDMEDWDSYAHQCSMDSFDIPAMLKDIQSQGYDVTEDMLTRWLNLWLQREGKTYLMERGITLSSPCSCCNPFLLSVYNNGDPTLEDLYVV